MPRSVFHLGFILVTDEGDTDVEVLQDEFRKEMQEHLKDGEQIHTTCPILLAYTGKTALVAEKAFIEALQQDT